MSQRPFELLLVDDEEPLRRLLAGYFEDFDEFHVRTAESGEDALEQLRLLPADICVVDVRMGGMTGPEFILLAAKGGLCAHFLVHTGHVDFRLPPALRELGMKRDDVLFKPADPKDLLTRICQRLGQRDEQP